MEVNNINPVKIKPDRPEPLVSIANTRKVKQESRETTVTNERSATVSKTDLERAVESANETGQLLKRKLNFSVDEATEKLVVKVIDEESGEVVRQIPANEMLRIAAHLKQFQEMNDRVMSAVKSIILDVRY
ncbi:MAG TPA: flagellar protein FlaG [Nitrospirae bacterium]|nr:flagellar protein FlaG [bacterium BMS3Abin06]HDH11420.1 flagellar protein FlaG [Nitrospirota bacterium]HDZ01426.1 flagellar protein FlaG [Nitrospirota bacterium]